MGRGRGCPIASPPRFSPLAPQSIVKQQLAASIFHLDRPLSDPYLNVESVTSKPYEKISTIEENEFDEQSYLRGWNCDWQSNEDQPDDDYDDRWDSFADEFEGKNARRATRGEHLSKERFAVHRLVGKQRHLHVSVHQIRRAESKEFAKLADEKASGNVAVAPQHHVSSYSAARHGSKPACARSNWGTGASAGGWERSPQSHAPVMQTSTGRRVQLSREEQDVAAAIQASLAADANVAGGLSMEQLAELLTRDLSPNDYEMLLRLDDSVQKKTLSVEAIEKLPQRLATTEDAGVKCAICQSEYEAGENLQSTPCQHLFHADCLTAWLTKSSTKCALCNHSLEQCA